MDEQEVIRPKLDKMLKKIQRERQHREWLLEKLRKEQEEKVKEKKNA